MSTLITERELDIPFKGKKRSKTTTIAVCITTPNEWSRPQAVLLTHGAGGDMNTSQLKTVSQAVAKAGYLCVRFTCKPPVLQHRLAAYRNVLDWTRAQYPAVKSVVVSGNDVVVL
jgi:alpha/beta superfamily hydrolase